MNANKLLHGCAVIAAVGCAALHAQMPPQPQVSFTEGSSSTWNADWDGVANRTYFIQGSPDLANWYYLGEMAFGTGLQGCGVDATGTSKLFIRLRYLDDPAITTLQEAREADFDGDGIPNYYEIEELFSDPFDTNSAGGDTDHDRLPDGWEMYRFGNLSQDGYGDPDEDGYTNFEELALGSNPVAADAPFTDTDEDGIPDAYESKHGLNGAVDDSLEDGDGDHIPNIFEYKNGSSASDSANTPPFDYIVDKETGSQNSGDNVFSKVRDALTAASFSPWDDVNDMPGPPARPYKLILVKPGTHVENPDMSGVPVLLVGERGHPSGPPVIAGKDGATIQIQSRSVLDNLIITHAAGQKGTGIDVQYWQNEPGDPVTLSRRRMVNCVIRGNSDTYGPGGIYSGGTQLVMDHCTIFSNTGEESATGVLQSEGSLTLNNTIIWGNNAQQSATGNTQLLVTNGATLLTSAASPNIIADPNTLSAPGWIDGIDPSLTPAGWLKSDSPAINGGGAIANTSTTFDIHGELRNLDTAPDIGADEYLDANGTNDGDGLPDWAEGSDDNDGLNALDEYQLHGTNPRLADTDGDGMNDGDEATNGFNPLADEDRDLDSMSDAWEFIHGLDWQTDDSLDDKDGDRIPNVFEYQLGTSPVNVQDFPAITFEVDPATGNNDPYDNIYATIAEALDAAYAPDADNDYQANPYPVILIRGGVYDERISLSDIPILLLGELGAQSGPVEIKPSSSGTTLFIGSRSAVDGLIVSHATGVSGSGVWFSNSLNDISQRRRLTNCIIRGNNSIFGGGIFANGCEPELVHCTIIGNSSTQNYPGIKLTDSDLHLINSVVAGNTGSSITAWAQIEMDSESSVSASESCPSFIGDEPETTTPGWIVVPDPGLSPNGWIQDAYTSVVDSGGIIPATKVLYDLHGQLRSAGGIPDVGADEFIPEYSDPEDPGSGSGSSVDSDGDGIPDQWEIAHNLDPQIPNSDSDLQDYLNESANTSDLLIHTPLQ